MTDQELEQRLRSWYQAEVPADLTAPADLRSKVVAIPRPASQPWRGSARRRGFTLLAAAALTGTIVGTAMVGGFLNRPDRSVVPPIQTRSTDASPILRSGAPSVVPGSSGLIAYVKFVPHSTVAGECTAGVISFYEDQIPTDCSRIWVSNPDGTDAHELLPGHPGYQTPIAWSPDGTRLLYEDATGLWLTDSTGTVLQSLPFESLCGLASPCYSYTFSPDGTRLALVRSVERDPRANESIVAIVDLETGEVTDLETTYASMVEDPGFPCAGVCDSGSNYGTTWSPDGTRLVFGRWAIGVGGDSTLLMVNVDGTDLRQLVPMDRHAFQPRWSPDGGVIAFVQNTSDDEHDIYLVRPDGTDIRRLTSDGVESRPEWTRDGRLVFTRTRSDAPAGRVYELWIMDANGANKAMLPVDDVVALTAAGCLICAWVRDPDSDIPETEFQLSALWKPTP